MNYIDGFVIPLPVDKIEEYRRQAEAAGKIWMEHGALNYRECIADDMRAEGLTSFPELARTDEGETVIFSYIVFRSREHRDEVNAKVMADPRIQDMCNPEAPPFDVKRMAYAGFRVLVDF
ncbi:MAG: DUF1428 domain-containing protein [Desulfuromonadales bacterium]|nr:DUF1428 domain-containing protein [Desulfuromonadales bacterium]